VICTSCGVLVGVNDDKCYNCGRRNPGLWGFAPLLRALGNDLGFVPFVMSTCAIIYVLTLIFSRGGINQGGIFGLLAPTGLALVLFGGTSPQLVFDYGRWWTIISASWLHGGLLHIGMNMYAMSFLGPAVAEMRGQARRQLLGADETIDLGVQSGGDGVPVEGRLERADLGAVELRADRLERQRHVRASVAVRHRVDVEPVQLLLVRAQCVTESEHRLWLSVT